MVLCNGDLERARSANLFMSETKQNLWRTMTMFLANLLAFIAITLSGWTAQELTVLQADVASLKALVPTEYPPRWFVEQYQRDQLEWKEKLEKMDRQLQDNRDLILKLVRSP